MLFQRPIFMIEKIGTLLRYMAIAAPDRIEWVPISCVAIPRRLQPVASTPARREFVIIDDVMCSSLLFDQKAETLVSSLVLGYDKILLTMFAHCLTGHNTSCCVRHCMIFSIFESFF